MVGCYLGGSFYSNNQSELGFPCEVCQASTNSWVSKSNGSSCGAGFVCDAGSCLNDCYIGGVFTGNGLNNPGNSCQVCQASTNTYTNKIGTNCGPGDVCDAGSCLNDCYIGGVFTGNGLNNPGNSCQTCQASTNTYTNKSNGTGCGGAGLLCDAGSCLNDCFIGGVFTGNGLNNPGNSCQVCQASTNTYTNKSNGASCGAGDVCDAGSCLNDCYIGGVFTGNGLNNPGNSCQKCQASTNTWVATGNGNSCGGNSASVAAAHA